MIETRQQPKSREITDEDVERMQARVGVEMPQLNPFNEHASLDGIRHYAEGVGASSSERDG